VLSATVNLTSETALVSVSPLLPEEKTSPNWQKELGETLAHHLTTCGFTSALRGIQYTFIFLGILWSTFAHATILVCLVVWFFKISCKE
jgi:hypothetical protein